MESPPRLHPTDETLIGFGLGKLDDASGDAVNRHLERCDACRRRVAEMSADTFLGRLRDAKWQPDVPSFRSLAGGTDDYRPGSTLPPPADETLPPGLADHPDYRVVRELGRGGMGVVYLARNRLMGRDEVLKVMGRQVIGRTGVLDRFIREIQAVARLRHPNIVAAYHAFRLGESIVFAMEYVDGYDLARLVKARGPLPVAHAAFFAHQVALGLQHAHEEGMVHRDIKPHNLMLTRKGDRGTIKILDFGLAKATRESPVDGALTHANQMLGSPDFIAPEQSIDAQKADIRADLYSLGCTLYYLLTGGPPFRGTSLYDILQAHHSMDAKPLNFARSEVPVELAALVAKLMAKEPARRFQTPVEVARALTPFFKKNEPTDAKPSRDTLIATAEPTEARQSPVPGPGVVPKPVVVAPAIDTEDEIEPEPQWENLIDLAPPVSGPTDSKSVLQPAVRRRPSNPRRLWLALAMGLLFIGGLAAATVKVMTRDGVIVLEGLPREAEVFVDGSKVRVTWPSGKSAEVSVPAGQRGVEVHCDGYQTFGEKVSIEPGGEGRVTVALIPLPSQPTSANRRGEPDEIPSRVADGIGQGSGEGSPGPMQGMVSLLNGKDLTGWRTNPENPVSWDVQDGVMRTSSNGRLYTDRNNYDNFYLRAEMKAEVNCKGNILIRSTLGPRLESAYQIHINTIQDRTDQHPSGSLMVTDHDARTINVLAEAEESLVRPDHWFVLEIIAVDNHFVVKIDGKTACSADDPNRTYSSGYIAINRSYEAKGGELHCRRVDIAELDGSLEKREESLKRALSIPYKPASAPSHGNTTLDGHDFPATVLAGGWEVKDDELVENQRATKPAALLVFGDPSWSNYDLKFKAKATGGTHGFKAILHYDPESKDNLYLFAYGNYHNRGHDLSYVMTGIWGRDRDMYKTGKIQFDRWYDVKIEVRESTIRCFVDDVKLFDHEGDRFKNGLIGFSTWDSTAHFRDIEVVSPEGKVLFKGLPRLPKTPPPIPGP